MTTRRRPKPARGHPQQAQRPDPPKPRDWSALASFGIDSKRVRKPLHQTLYTTPTNGELGVYKPPPGIIGQRDDNRLAQDNALETAANNNWNFYGGNNILAGTYLEGINFLPYPYAAILSQRSEFRQPIVVLAEEMTRKGITLKSSGDEDLTDQIAQLTDAFNNKFMCMDRLREAAETDLLFGLSFLYPDILQGTQPVDEDRDELRRPLILDKAKLGKDCLRGFNIVEPLWTSATNYNSIKPTAPDFYKPNSWWINGVEYHASRLLQFVSNPVPRYLKPRYNFGGLSLVQMLMPYVDNWLQTRQSVSDLIQAYSTWVLKTDMSAFLAGEGGGADIDWRVNMFSLIKNNRGVFAIDKEAEEFANVAAPLAGLAELQSQAQEHMASTARMPLLKMFGIQPAGLGQSDDNSIRVFYDTIKGMQQRIFTSPIRTMLDLIQLNEFGKIHEDIQFEFNPLWELDEAGRADIAKVQADTDAVYLNSGVMDAEEVRDRLGADEHSIYSGLEGPPPEPEFMEGDEAGPPVDYHDNAGKVTGASAQGKTNGASNGV